MTPTACWYADHAHRPQYGFVPTECTVTPAGAERMAGGDERYYCESHLYWRRQANPHAPVRRLR